jgi:hypothetical protein
MPRETKDQKAVRFITQERVRFSRLTPTAATGTVRGDTEDYESGMERGSWFCACVNGSAQCSHLIAARMIYRAIAPVFAEGRKNHGE